MPLDPSPNPKTLKSLAEDSDVSETMEFPIAVIASDNHPTGTRVWAVKFRVQGLKFRAEGLGFRV